MNNTQIENDIELDSLFGDPMHMCCCLDQDLSLCGCTLIGDVIYDDSEPVTCAECIESDEYRDNLYHGNICTECIAIKKEGGN